MLGSSDFPTSVEHEGCILNQERPFYLFALVKDATDEEVVKWYAHLAYFDALAEIIA